MNYKKFYKELGKLLYAIAKADGTIRPKETETLRNIVKKELKPLESSNDEYGMDNAFYTEFEFEILEEYAADPEVEYKAFIAFVKENRKDFDDVKKKLCVKLVEEVAEAYKGTNNKEQRMIDDFKKEIMHL